VSAPQGSLKLGSWQGTPIYAHWTIPVAALVFSQGRFVPGYWLGFFLVVFIHEMGHAFLVRTLGYHVLSVEVHGLGGVCRWRGDATAIHRAQIAWGGVAAQALALVVTLGLRGHPR
jgi:hypothetical protein